MAGAHVMNGWPAIHDVAVDAFRVRLAAGLAQNLGHI
jgi:hypothetical protein